MILCGFVMLFMFGSLVSAQLSDCNRDNGPSGSVRCIQLTRYSNAYQWATCLTNVYIKQKSAHKHICSDQSATYCWYQCMIEVHNKDSGAVTKDCTCQPSSLSTAYPRLTTTSLPPHCYSPSGKLCSWYENCLEKKYPCESSSIAYAITYAKHFCELYGKSYKRLSSKGQQWVDGVRKCLQVSLVPLLRPWNKPSCKEIRETALKSHIPCYLNPDKDAPSVCDLECTDFMQIFFTIKGSFVKFDTAWDSMKGMWNVLYQCGPKCSTSWLQTQGNGVINVFKMQIKKFKQRKRRSISEQDDQNASADRLVSALASTLKWQKDAMVWLAYPDNTTTSQGLYNEDIFLVLADKKALGIVDDPFKQSEGLNKTIRDLTLAVKQGKLPLQIDGSNVWIKSMDFCSDQNCHKRKSRIVSNSSPSWPQNGVAEVSLNYQVSGIVITIATYLYNFCL